MILIDHIYQTFRFNRALPHRATSIIFSFILLLLPAAAQVVSPAQDATISEPGIWVAGHHAVLRVDAATGLVTRTIPLTHRAVALAVDPNDQGLWVLTRKQLLKFSVDTSLVRELELNTLIPLPPRRDFDRDKEPKERYVPIEDPEHLVLNPFDGSVSIADEKVLVHLDHQGGLLWAWESPEEIQALALSLDESFRVLTRKQLLHVAKTGALIGAQPLKGMVDMQNRDFHFLAIDSPGGVLWFASKQSLYRWPIADMGQRPPVQIYPAASAAERHRSHDDDAAEQIHGLALDPRSGTVWIAAPRALLGFTRLGILSTTAELHLHSLKYPEHLAFDALTQSLWFGSRKDLARFSANGAFVSKLRLDEEVEALGVTPLLLTPSLSLLQPATGSISNDPKLPLRFKLGALCQDTACEISTAYVDGLTLEATLDGASIGPQLLRQGSDTVFIPADRYREGAHTWTAQARDTFGHLSGSLAGSFTIDTVPPEIRLETPPAALTRTPNQNFIGTLSEAAKLTINEQIVLLDAQRRFHYPATLKQGLNAFVLTATDLAGNITAHTVTITLDTVAPRFLSLTPADGSSVTASEVMVNGSLDDAGATIALDNLAAFSGEVVSSDPLNFSFRLRLPSGSHTLILTAQDSAGNTRQAHVRLTFSPLSLKVTNVTPGAGIVSDNLVLVGTYEGPLNTGITVNGQIAQLFNKQFFVTVPLNMGENTLTITATTLEGGTSTQTLIVNRTGTAGITVERVPVSTADGTFIATLAGNGAFGYAGDGGPATQAKLRAPAGIAWDADGGLYIADTQNHRIRRVAPDGTIATVAGTGEAGFSGDGGPAMQAQLSFPWGITLGPDRSLYIADQSNARIRRIDPQGVITTVAGSGVSGFAGDGGSAMQAQLRFPRSIVIAADGTLYIADTFNHRIRRVTPNGVITTIAGTGVAAYSGDGGPATQARLFSPSALALGQDGSLTIADTGNFRIRRIDAGGTITTVAGTGVRGAFGDNGPAAQARLAEVFGITLSRDGALYVSDTGNNRIRVVGTNNIITPFAGTGVFGYAGDSGPPTQARFASPMALAIERNNNLAIADTENHRIRKIAAVNVAGTGAPLLAVFQVTNQTGKTLQKIDVDFDGNGTMDFTTTNVTAVIKHVYERPGIYLTKFAVTDSQNSIYSVVYPVVIEDVIAKDEMLRAVYTGMVDHLKAGNLQGALNTISGSARDKYQRIFTTLQPDLPGIVNQLGELKGGTVGEGMAEYVLVRNQNGVSRAYLIYLIRGEDGVWRIEGM